MDTNVFIQVLINLITISLRVANNERSNEKPDIVFASRFSKLNRYDWKSWSLIKLSTSSLLKILQLIFYGA